jgi:hypothetical protein
VAEREDNSAAGASTSAGEVEVAQEIVKRPAVRTGTRSQTGARWYPACTLSRGGIDIMTKRAGISNRETPDEEAQERQEHPPIDTGSPPPEDAAGRKGEQPLTDTRDRQTSHKAGSRSIAQKESESRYPDRSMPASRKVPGAFGKE